MNSFRVLIVDDHPILRGGLRSILETRADLEICAEMTTGREAVEAAGKLKPDAIVMDLTMPDMNGLEATRRILQQNPEAQILILTAHESEQMIRDALDSGARGYLLKSDARDNLLNAIDCFRQGKTYFTGKVSDLLLSEYRGSPQHSADATSLEKRLTAREHEITQLLAEGRTNKEIAQTLNISVKTVETHRATIMRKLNLGNLADLVRYAIRNNIIQA